jgi:hypothetical protein
VTIHDEDKKGNGSGLDMQLAAELNERGIDSLMLTHLSGVLDTFASQVEVGAAVRLSFDHLPRIGVRALGGGGFGPRRDGGRLARQGEVDRAFELGGERGPCAGTGASNGPQASAALAGPAPVRAQQCALCRLGSSAVNSAAPRIRAGQ